MTAMRTSLAAALVLLIACKSSSEEGDKPGGGGKDTDTGGGTTTPLDPPTPGIIQNVATGAVSQVVEFLPDGRLLWDRNGALVADGEDLGVLPSDHYALCDQQAGDTIPDVLTLQEITSNGDGTNEFDNGDGGIGVATLTKTMPKVRQIQHVEADLYAARRKSIVIRHSSDDRIVAMIEEKLDEDEARRKHPTPTPSPRGWRCRL